MSIAWKELHAAVQILLGPGTQRERLASAFTTHLMWLRPHDLPVEWRDRFIYLINVLYINQLHEPWRRKDHVLDFPNREAYVAMAYTVFELYDAVNSKSFAAIR
jgi:hypothetical protein